DRGQVEEQPADKREHLGMPSVDRWDVHSTMVPARKGSLRVAAGRNSFRALILCVASSRGDPSGRGVEIPWPDRSGLSVHRYRRTGPTAVPCAAPTRARALTAARPRAGQPDEIARDGPTPHWRSLNSDGTLHVPIEQTRNSPPHPGSPFERTSMIR